MAAAYSASKAAVIALTKAIGKDLARTGVHRQLHRAGSDRDADPRGDLAGRTSTTWSSASRWAGWEARTRSRRCLLARERGVLVLDGRDLRHLRRAGGLLMLRVRVRGPDGIEHGAVHDGVVLTERGEPITPLDAERLTLADPYELLLPARAARGLVRRRHLRALARRARRGERGEGRLHARLRRRAARALPQGRRLPAHGRAGRADRRPRRTRPGTSPSPRSASCSATDGEHRRRHDRQRRLVARDRGREPALPAAGEGLRGRVRARAGRPRPRVPDEPLEIRMRIHGDDGREVFAGETSTARMKRTFAELVEYLLRDNPVPRRQRPPHRHGARPARRLHARARPRRRDPGARDRHAREPRRARLQPRWKGARPCLRPSPDRRRRTTSAASGARARPARRTRSATRGGRRR